MPISSAEILIKLSVKTGAAGNTTAGTPNDSLGKYISTTTISLTALNNLFDNVSGDENDAMEEEYRCIFVHNNHATLTYLSPVVWLFNQVAGGTDVSISVDTTAASAVGSASAQAKEIANEDTAPASQTFSAPTTKLTGLALGDIPAGQVKAVWVKRAAMLSAAMNNDGATLRVEGDTGA